MYGYTLLDNPEIANLKVSRLRSLFPQYTFETFVFDCGDKVYVKGPGVPFLLSGTSECGDPFTSAGILFCYMNEKGLVSEAVMSNLLER